MKREERKLVQLVHDSSGTLLAAKGVAETYMARVEFVSAMGALYQWAWDTAIPYIPEPQEFPEGYPPPEETK